MYSYDDIFSNEKELKLVKILLDLAKENGTYDLMTKLLFEGHAGSFNISSNMSSKDRPKIEQERRISLAYLLLTNPETFKELSTSGSFIFHGTNINALPGILKYGLNSYKKSMEQGLEVSTGEQQIIKINAARDFVSFADVFDIASDYSTLLPADKPKISFPIIICTNKENASKYRRGIIHSDIPEIGLTGGMNVEDITAILVPSDKIKYVKKIVGDKNIKVLGMDGQDKKFYWYDDFYSINVFENKLENFKDNLNKKNTSRFNISDIKELANGRLLSGIKKQFQKLTNLLKSEDKEYVGKCR